MKTIATSARGVVIQGGFQVVISQKPIECSPSLRAPTLVTGCAIRFETCRNCCTCLYRLLIETSFLARLAVETLRADRDKVAVHVAALLRSKPVQRLEASRKQRFVRGARACQQERLGQTCVGIGQTIFKPVPTRRAGVSINLQQPVSECVSLPLCGPVAREAIKVFLDSKQGKRPCSGTGKSQHRRNGKFKETPGETP